VSDERGSANDDDSEAMLGNLPVQLTRLIGREEALAELRALVWRGRMLSLCGPGGAGKSRLALALAETLQADVVGGTWWVDLSATLDSKLVAQTVVSTLLPDEPANDPTSTIIHHFTDPALVVLDNCEQVVDGCAQLVVALLSRCPTLRVLATSRQPLGVPGEQVWRVPGLAIPEQDEPQSPGGAVELFIERAGQADSSFDPSRADVLEGVRQICQWLDGIPLAIELAAARVPILGVIQIAERLEQDSANFLGQASTTAPSRHRTLYEALEWSHEMLEPVERRLFRRLAAFRGSFSLAAVEEVCGDADLPRPDVLPLLGALVDRSLVQVVESPELPRYRLLGTVRQYAAERLEADPEEQSIRERHARFFQSLASGAQAASPVGWTDRIELESDNLSEALGWLLREAAADAATLASLLWPFWYQRGYYGAARGWFDSVLSSSAEIPPPALAAALIDGAVVAFLQCDYPVATERLERAIGLTDELGDQRAKADVLQRLGSIAREQARYPEARDLHERSLAISHELGDRHGVALSQNYLGFVAWLSGDPWTGERLCAAALEEFQRAGELQDAALSLVNLGACALYRDDAALAAERLEESLAIVRRLGFQEGVAWSLHELAIVGRRRRRPVHENAARLREALSIHDQLGDLWRTASVLEEIVVALLARRDPRQAARVLAATDALREQLATPIPPAEKPDRDAALAQVQRALSPSVFASAWSDGRGEETERVVESVLTAIDDQIGAAREAKALDAPILTPRELAVLELLSEGHTNREIAAALYISPSTAGVHVSNVLRKLGAKRRVDAATIGHRLGLLQAPETEPTHQA
jgi:predicted ATPase/DNA-binding NarL/FixJ family response regulator